MNVLRPGSAVGAPGMGLIVRTKKRCRRTYPGAGCRADTLGQTGKRQRSLSDVGFPCPQCGDIPMGAMLEPEALDDIRAIEGPDGKSLLGPTIRVYLDTTPDQLARLQTTVGEPMPGC